MEKVVHLFKTFKTIFYFNFSEHGKVLFPIGQSLEIFELF
jgi:hypothetical protein